jgi:hypothetical protein
MDIKFHLKLISLLLTLSLGFNTSYNFIANLDTDVQIENIDFEESEKKEKEDKAEEDKLVKNSNTFVVCNIYSSRHNLYIDHYQNQNHLGVHTPPPEFNS